LREGLAATAAARIGPVYRGEIIYFCSPGCKKKFDENSERYVGRASTAKEQEEETNPKKPPRKVSLGPRLP
jgi:YHS domain-containing protein